MGKIVIRNGTVVTMDSERRVLQGYDVLLEDDRIVAIGQELPAGDAEVIDARDAIVMPGMVDTHMHAWQYPWRGLVQRKWGSGPYMKVFWPIRETYDPRDTHDGIVGCGFEMINHGITSTLDFFHGANSTSEHADAALAAHRRTGQRVQLAYGMTAAYGMTDPKEFEKARLARVADFDRLHHEAAAAQKLVEVGLALITPSDALMDSFVEEIAHARSLGAQMTFHQNAAGEIRAIHERGVMGPDIVPVHSNTVSDQELRWMAEVDMPISVTPQTEITSARSMSVLRRSILQGVTLSIGVDTPAILPIDMLGQLKLSYLLMQESDADVMREAVRAPLDVDLDPQTATFDDVFAAGTTGGAHAIGHGGNLGVLKEGALADIVIVRPRDVDVALGDPVPHLILTAADPNEVDTVIIGGEVRKRNSELVGIDPAELSQLNRDVRKRVLARIDR